MKTELGIKGLLFMYVGNLQPYQGIDLLLESFALALEKSNLAELVIVGGQVSDIQEYQKKSYQLGIHRKVHFLGPKPVKHLAHYLSEADILVSPRIKGNNTPMKLYSYLHSAKALLATDLPTHSQVVDGRSAFLAEPSPEAFSAGMLRLIEDEALRTKLGIAGRKLAEEKFTYMAFRKSLNGVFDWLEAEIRQDRNVGNVNTDFPKKTAGG